MSVHHLHVTPHAVIEVLNEMLEAGNIEELYVVAITKDKRPAVSAAGDLKGMAFAIMTLKNFWDEVFE